MQHARYVAKLFAILSIYNTLVFPIPIPIQFNLILSDIKCVLLCSSNFNLIHIIIIYCYFTRIVTLHHCTYDMGMVEKVSASTMITLTHTHSDKITIKLVDEMTDAKIRV